MDKHRNATQRDAPAFNRPASHLGSTRLIVCLHVVFNPEILPNDLTKAGYMAIGQAMLQGVDAISLPDGWHIATSARDEMVLAEKVAWLSRWFQVKLPGGGGRKKWVPPGGI